ncbi:helix-turn-helix domain-containing protein [Planococcus soli]|uniref:helix-turn-helix domain-containing protein n=1 Tax=Planococcus soli TaxID=2666072 RepID=UPI00115E2F7A|nr:helix-turn-helix transcriptional regulator [Planococcus soli]
MDFGEKLTEIRKSKNLSLREAAKRSKISHPYLSQLESGKNKKPSPEIIRKLADGLNYSYNELMDLAGYGETVHYNTFRELFGDLTKNSMQDIIIRMPAMKVTKQDGLSMAGPLSKEEAARRLFDLKDWLELDMDLFYDRKNLSKEDREKIKTMLEILLKKE